MAKSLFIQVVIDEARCQVGQPCTECVKLCPVNIFVAQGNGIRIMSEAEDECTLCDLCLEACPAEAITIRKLYKEGH
ncbi:MAG: 4Fe-4S dicluster domain-containing protein [candidate division NC10 bacterium]|nr:4Fe-4S dicluster domain-containing protein [candidate division NC10 bacterium]